MKILNKNKVLASLQSLARGLQGSVQSTIKRCSPLTGDCNAADVVDRSEHYKTLQSLGRRLQRNQGFTLLEVAVAMFILSLGIVGILGLVNYSVKSETYSRKQVIASQLSQEAVELVRNKRDNNWLSSSVDWDADIGEGSYIMDYITNPNIISVSDINDPQAKLYIDNQGFYRHYPGGPPADATTTPFSRVISITDKDTAHDPPHYFTVQSIVKWEDNVGEHEYTAETVLYNWK